MNDRTSVDGRATSDEALGSAYVGGAEAAGATEADEVDDRDEDIDDAVIAADDTGMLAGERFITVVELAEGDADAGSV